MCIRDRRWQAVHRLAADDATHSFDRGHASMLFGPAVGFNSALGPSSRIFPPPHLGHLTKCHCEESRPGGTTKQSSWIATARFAHLAMTNVLFGALIVHSSPATHLPNS